MDRPASRGQVVLANGVTTIRTTGSFEPYTDLEIKKAVDAGTLIGPKMRVTSPYLEGEPFPLIQIHKLTGPNGAHRMGGLEQCIVQFSLPRALRRALESNPTLQRTRLSGTRAT